MSLLGDVRCGAQLAGYVEASYNRIGFRRGISDKSMRVHLEAVLRERLGSIELSTLDAIGAALTPQNAIALALAALHERPTDNVQSID
jgi:hypothetical protein